LIDGYVIRTTWNTVRQKASLLTNARAGSGPKNPRWPDSAEGAERDENLRRSKAMIGW